MNLFNVKSFNSIEVIGVQVWMTRQGCVVLSCVLVSFFDTVERIYSGIPVLYSTVYRVLRVLCTGNWILCVWVMFICFCWNISCPLFNCKHKFTIFVVYC